MKIRESINLHLGISWEVNRSKVQELFWDPCQR